MADDVLILIDQQKAMEHPKWGRRNNPDAEQSAVAGGLARAGRADHPCEA